ncbi:MAG: DMT family transporter [Acidimicrobiia bacterium]|nr:DMT family transporter [Acidimicrobiia bacterium]
MLRRIAAVWSGESELDYRGGAVLVAGSGIMFSFTGVFFRAIESATDWQFLLVRAAGALTAMLVITVLRAGRRPVPFRIIGWRTALAGVLLGAMSALYILAFARTSVATVTFLIAAGPLSGAFFGRVMLGERLHRSTVVAIAIAAVGIGVMAARGVDTGRVDGFVLAAVIPAILGLYNVLIRSTPNVDPVIPAIISNSLAIPVTLVMTWRGAGLDMPIGDAVLGFSAGFVLIGVGLPLFNLGHRSVPTAQISLLIMTEVVLAPLWVWIWPGETPATATLIGGALVIGAVVYQIASADRVPLRQPTV